MKYAIVAYDRNRAIGADHGIPWMGKMKADMAHVREVTGGNAIIMGRSTFDHDLRARALPNRQNIVVSSRPGEAENVTFVKNLDEAYNAVQPGKKPIIFGGARMYEGAIDTIDVVYATEIDTAADDADAFFPALGSEWHESSREHHDSDDENVYPYDFVTYEKR